MEFIRKDELMGMLDESIQYWKDKDDCTLITLLGVVDDVNKLPTIDSETVIYPFRPKGKWINFTCSECGFTPLIKPMELNVTKGFMKCTYKYCPDCGSYNVHDSEKGEG